MSWLDILGGLTAPVVGLFQRRAELKAEAAKQKAELADAMHKRQIDLITQGLAADATWEVEQIKNSSWKDEYVLIILSIPLIGCFISYTQQIVLNGFLILDKTPDWYRWMVVSIFMAIYGIRIWRRNQSDT